MILLAEFQKDEVRDAQSGSDRSCLDRLPFLKNRKAMKKGSRVKKPIPFFAAANTPMPMNRPIRKA
jgi:hypothetical protein